MWDGRRNPLRDGRTPWVAKKVADNVREYVPPPEPCGPVTADQTTWTADSGEIRADMTTTCDLTPDPFAGLAEFE